MPLQNPKNGLRNVVDTPNWSRLRFCRGLRWPSTPVWDFVSGQSGAKNSKNITKGRAEQWWRIQLMYFTVSLCVLSFILVSVVMDFGWFWMIQDLEDDPLSVLRNQGGKWGFFFIFHIFFMFDIYPPFFISSFSRFLALVFPFRLSRCVNPGEMDLRVLRRVKHNRRETTGKWEMSSLSWVSRKTVLV